MEVLILGFWGLVGSWSQDGPQTPPRGAQASILEPVWLIVHRSRIDFRLILYYCLVVVFDWFGDWLEASVIC